MALLAFLRQVTGWAVLPVIFAGTVTLPSALIAQADSAPSGKSASIKVWVNTGSGVYHCPGTRYYGTTRAGAYFFEPEARAKGYRPAYGRLCGPLAADSGSKPSPAAAAVPAPGAGARVWVNTSSGVYHCPGSRYYGTTRVGKYMARQRLAPVVIVRRTAAPASRALALRARRITRICS